MKNENPILNSSNSFSNSVGNHLRANGHGLDWSMCEGIEK
jgi:hypothetical protein